MAVQVDAPPSSLFVLNSDDMRDVYDAFGLGKVEDFILGAIFLIVEANVVVYLLLMIGPMVLR